MLDNTYVLVARRMEDADLIKALDQHEKYVDEMLLAMLEECNRRGIVHPHAEHLQTRITEAMQQQLAEEMNNVLQEAMAKEENVPLPVFYSQTAILAFTIFFSPIFGGTLLAMNVSRIHKKAVWPIVIFSIIFTAFSGYVGYVTPQGSIVTLLIPIAGALLLSEFMWNRYIGKNVRYQRRSIFIPLVIALIITLPLIYFFYQHPELLSAHTQSDNP
ncbi:MAG: hypothetical protein R2794_04550 [Chitinophagales bacterium]